MSLIQITDNHHDWKRIADCLQEQPSEQDLSLIKTDLVKIANIKIGNLTLEDNPNLLVFPRDLHRYGDEISESHII